VSDRDAIARLLMRQNPWAGAPTSQYVEDRRGQPYRDTDIDELLQNIDDPGYLQKREQRLGEQDYMVRQHMAYGAPPIEPGELGVDLGAIDLDRMREDEQ
jgi:hypothetical protein